MKPTDTRGFVFFSAQDYWYHNRAHSDFQLTRGLAAARPTVLVNSIGMRMPTPTSTTQPLRRIARKLASVMRAARRPEPALADLLVLSPFFLPLYGSSVGRRLNARLVAVQVRLALRRLGVRRPDVIVTIPTAVDAAGLVRRRSLSVNRSDKFSAFPEANQTRIADMERQLLREADLVVYVSRQLMDEEWNLVGGRSHYLGHGVDAEHFVKIDREATPADIANLPRPIFGFFGGLDDYVVDFELLRALADSMTEGTLVLIGDATCDISMLTDHPRVAWLGPRPYAEIPAYGSAFDVALMPWLDCDWIAHCNPIKMKEYLALGLPVVTTFFPEALAFEDVMAIAHSREEFVALVHEAALSSGVEDAEKRRARVLTDSWGSRSEALLQLIDESHS